MQAKSTLTCFTSISIVLCKPRIFLHALHVLRQIGGKGQELLALPRIAFDLRPRCHEYLLLDAPYWAPQTHPRDLAGGHRLEHVLGNREAELSGKE